MKIVVINEVSASVRNADIIKMLSELGLEAYNVGMTNPDDTPQLTYIQTGLMAGLLLNSGAADFVIGGCGTGQGFFNSAMQYPNVFCGLITDPLDAFLFSQINDGNCISLALLKGYGWAGEINLRYIFQNLFSQSSGKGYPPSRSESQQNSRKILKNISRITHNSMNSIITGLAEEITGPVLSCKIFTEHFRRFAQDGELKNTVLNLIK